ncbi:snapalysin [Amycolatopsis arida]|uniref:Extracellular small neutral protease n=1 Tax=Amycolatopsis arida TaxID=587909 RepID=A0A1I5QNC4_9PSEU|nr:snapalysin family zinc-dependent metalloprotease [Amycolatopsis arida]TDX98896.1 snapalysin [Amycolatopsis arida]SFP47356.1 snapalysin [Amycolatopsis arida]
MPRRIVATFVLALTLGLVQVVGGPAALGATDDRADRGTVAVRTLYYDSSGAAEFKDAVDQGAQIWNESVRNVRLVKGSPASIRVVADNGWPRAYVPRLGSGTIYMGRQAVNQGHHVVRIAAHEFGHILGLPDRRTGRCEDLMSGASAGTSCTNPYPNATERAQVERNFGGGSAAETFGGVFVEDSRRMLAAH